MWMPVMGGPGLDFVLGETGDDTITGGESDDVIVGNGQSPKPGDLSATPPDRFEPELRSGSGWDCVAVGCSGLCADEGCIKM